MVAVNKYTVYVHYKYTGYVHYKYIGYKNKNAAAALTM